MKHLTGALIALALIFAGVFCVTFATVTQSIPLLLFLLAGIVVLIHCRKELYGGNYSLKVFTLVTVIYFMVRAYLSPVSSLARQDMFLISSGAMLYCYLGICMPSKIVRKWSAMGFVAILCFNLLNWIPAVDEWRDSIMQYANGEPNTGLFHHRNFYGNFMCMMACLCGALALFDSNKSKVFRLTIGMLGVGSAVSVVFSTSRSSFLALAVGACVLIACLLVVKSRASGKKNHGLQIVLGFGFILVIVVGVIFGGKFVLDERSRGIGEADSRQNYFALSIEQIPDAPILGSGSRSVEYKSYEYWPMEMFRVFSDYRFVHNEYLQSITDYGVIGFILLFMAFMWHLINGATLLYHRSASKNSSEIAYVVAGLSILIGLSVNMLFSFPMHGFINFLLIMFAASMLLGESDEKKNRESQPKLALLLKPISLLTIVSMMIYSGIEGGKESIAFKAFLKQGIVADDLHWVQNEDTNDQWREALDEVIDISPTYSRYNKLGEILLVRENFDEAYIAYQRSKEMHPYSPTSRISLARIYILKGQYEEAEKEFQDVEYLVKNREPLFNYYRNLADFYLSWSYRAPDLRSDLFAKAREACNLSLEKNDNHINHELRKTLARVLLACYHDELSQLDYDEAFRIFDEFVLVCIPMSAKSDVECKIILSDAKEMLKHADLCWNKGLMSRAAEATYRAHVQYYRYKHFMKGEVNQAWINEVHQIKLALDMFKDAGVKINKK